MWGFDKGEARVKVFEFMNNQNLRVVKEIEPSSFDSLVQQMSRNKTTLVNEISHNNPK